jgi:hypothetical protein
VSHGSPFPPDPVLLVVTRFNAPDPESFTAAITAAVEVLAQSAGFISADLGQATDEADLMVLTTRWMNVGSYRKALSRFEVKMHVVPLLSQAIDESSAFEIIHTRTPTSHIDAVSGRFRDE